MILIRIIFSISFLLIEFFLSIPALFFLIFSKRTKSGFLERLGFIKQEARSEAYVFAPSLGDVRSVLPVARLLKEELSMSVTFMIQTHSGMAEAFRCKSTGPASFAPIDGFLQQLLFFKTAKPKLLVLETKEIWPGLLLIAWLTKVPVIWVNALITENKVFKYKCMNFIFPFIAKAISEPFPRHYMAERNIKQAGFLSFDKETICSWTKFEDLLKESNRASSDTAKDIDLVIGSIQKSEEKLIKSFLSFYLKRYPSRKVAVVPRHIEEFSADESFWQQENLELVLENGVLKDYYKRSVYALVGGSFIVGRGGQNPFEASLFGCITFTGFFTDNFEPLLTQAVEKGIITRINLESDDLLLEKFSSEFSLARADKIALETYQFLSNIGNADKMKARIREVMAI